MTILGLAEAVVAPLVRAVAERAGSPVVRADAAGADVPGADVPRADVPRSDASGVDPSGAGTARAGAVREPLDGAELAERFARAAWSHLAEPGDGVAGALVAGFGALGALERVVARTDPARLADELAERSGTEAVPRAELALAVARWAPRVVASDVLRELRQAARFDVGLVVPDDQDWPGMLDDLGRHAPLALWLRGRREALAGLPRGIAIVGARAATGYGEHVAVELASGLADRGYAIVSGAAYGIDGIAHRAALASQGETVAFLAGGLDRFYPSGHEALLARIVERGAAISEVPCGVAPTRWRFLQRNRLIAAASRATVVVEAGWRSGSLNTAHHALELGRPVGAVPGPVTSSASAGCHRLLREDPAVCVTSAGEVAELAPLAPAGAAAVVAPADGDAGDGLPFGAPGSSDGERGPGASGSSRQPPARGFDPEGARLRLLDALSERSPRDPDRLAAISGLAPDRVRAELGLLELDGRVRRGATGWTRSPA